MATARYLVFGAGGHIGGPLATALGAQAGAQALRLATSSPAKVGSLRAAHPDVEIVVANYLDEGALTAALNGIASVFVVTPDFFDDRRGTEILLAACARAEVRPHIVRIQAEVPGMTIDRLPGILAQPIGRRGHLEARQLIETSGLPATFLNVFGYYMDDLIIHFGADLGERRMLSAPYDRPMCWIDPHDLGAAAAAVMAAASPAAPQLIHLNSGEDGILFSALAVLLSDVLGTSIGHDPDPKGFVDRIGPILSKMTGHADAADYLLADWRMERDHAALYRGNGALEELIGRSPVTLQQWIKEHRAQLLG